MQEKETEVQGRGPNSILDVRDKGMGPGPARKTGAQVTGDTSKAEPVYVFASGVVDVGDKQPIPALTFVRVSSNRIRRLAEVARRNGVGFVVCPSGWHPGR